MNMDCFKPGECALQACIRFTMKQTKMLFNQIHLNKQVSMLKKKVDIIISKNQALQILYLRI